MMAPPSARFPRDLRRDRDARSSIKGSDRHRRLGSLTVGLDQEAVLQQIGGLLDEYAALQQRSRYDDLSDLKDELQAFVVRLRACIDRMVPPTSSYFREAEKVTSTQAHIRVPAYVGILRALGDDVGQGWLKGVEELVHADTFADQLEQADELLRAKYKDAAAVVGGVALESHLRSLAAKSGVDIALPSGGPKKADVINVDLVKAGVYTTIQQKAITAWLGIRNASAHGEYNKYELAEVRQMLASISDLIARYPA